MKIVLLSGGSGSRLWPLSNAYRSKQFLKVLEKDKTQKQSMVQRVFLQLKKIGLEKEILIATNHNQIDMLRLQLGQDIEIVTEPERRNTFPAISLAAAYLYLVKQCTLDEMIAVIPIDVFADDHYFKLIHSLEEPIRNENYEIALLGVEPTYPSEKYGYIIPDGNKKSSYKKVVSFKEKPSVDLANVLIQEKKALWNCGVFGFKLQTIIEKLKQYISFENYEDVYKQYNALPKISFDYEVVENCKSTAVIQYSGEWEDLGTWKSLSNKIVDRVNGKAILSEDSENTHIINELDIPIVAIKQISQMIVATPDGILVSDKEETEGIKKYLKEEQRPMYERRRWGEYKVLDYSVQEDSLQVLTKKIIVEAGKNLSYQYHNQRAEIWTIVEGAGVFLINGVKKNVKRGDVLNIKVGDKHAIKANTQLTFVEVQLGKELTEDDIVRIKMEF